MKFTHFAHMYQYTCTLFLKKVEFICKLLSVLDFKSILKYRVKGTSGKNKLESRFSASLSTSI